MAQSDFAEKIEGGEARSSQAQNGELADALRIDGLQIEYTDVMTGDKNRNRFLYYQLKRSMGKANRIDMIVSFLMESGVRMILKDLRAALARGVRVRILTGNYLGITQPSALYLIKKEKNLMNQYQFEQISREMERRYGKMEKGGEDEFMTLLLAMESNLLKVWRKYPDSNSRRLEEAILLVLHAIKNNTDAECVNAGRFESLANIRLRDALLAAFDPFSNESVRKALEEKAGMNLEDKEVLREYYRAPVICILRIKESVECWIKERGSNGYFDFLEECVGIQVPNDDEMSHAILLRR